MNKISFIGAGRMASAIVKGILEKNLCQPDDISCCAGNDDTGKVLAEKTGIQFYINAENLPAETELIILACKPQQLDKIDPAILELAKGKAILSIVAGKEVATLEEMFIGARLVIRCMPNTPGSIGEGFTGYSPSQELGPADKAAIEGILGSLGEVLEMPEPWIDLVTAISGSGPAYFFEFTAALAEAGKHLGFPDDVADRLARSTFIGAAKLLEQSGEDPVALRIAVTSPGGTTQAALETFEAANLRELVAKAATAAHTRSLELSK